MLDAHLRYVCPTLYSGAGQSQSYKDFAKQTAAIDNFLLVVSIFSTSPYVLVFFCLGFSKNSRGGTENAEESFLRQKYKSDKRMDKSPDVVLYVIDILQPSNRSACSAVLCRFLTSSLVPHTYSVPLMSLN